MSTIESPMIEATERPEGYRAQQTFTTDPAAVVAALTSPEAISRWWAPCTGSGSAGGQLHFLFGDAAVVVDVVVAGAGHVRWAVSVSEPLRDWVGTHIDFALRPSPTGGTVLDFCHEGLTERLECFDMCSAGWRQYLPSLVDYVDRDGGTAFGSEHDARARHWDETRARS